MTADHLRVILGDESLTALLYGRAQKLATGSIPAPIIKALRVGRLTALQKLDGGVRGIVAGDIFRRLVSRTLARQLSKKCKKLHRLSNMRYRPARERNAFFMC